MLLSRPSTRASDQSGGTANGKRVKRVPVPPPPPSRRSRLSARTNSPRRASPSGSPASLASAPRAAPPHRSNSAAPPPGAGLGQSYSELVQGLSTVFIDNGVEQEGNNAEDNLTELLRFAAADAATGVALRIPCLAKPAVNEEELAEEPTPLTAEEAARVEELYHHFIEMNEMVRQGKQPAAELARWHARWLGRHDEEESEMTEDDRSPVAPICSTFGYVGGNVLSGAPPGASLPPRGRRAAGFQAGGDPTGRRNGSSGPLPQRRHRWIPVAGLYQVPSAPGTPRSPPVLTREAEAVRKRLGVGSPSASAASVRNSERSTAEVDQTSAPSLRVPSARVSPVSVDWPGSAPASPRFSAAGTPRAAPPMPGSGGAAELRVPSRRSLPGGPRSHLCNREAAEPSCCSSCGNKLVCVECALVRRVDVSLDDLPVAKLVAELTEEVQRHINRENALIKSYPGSRQHHTRLRDFYHQLLIDPPWQAWLKRKDASIYEIRIRCDESERVAEGAKRTIEELKQQIEGHRQQARELEQARDEVQRSLHGQHRREQYLRERYQQCDKDRVKYMQRLAYLEGELGTRSLVVTEEERRSALELDEARRRNEGCLAVLREAVASARGASALPSEAEVVSRTIFQSHAPDNARAPQLDITVTSLPSPELPTRPGGGAFDYGDMHGKLLTPVGAGKPHTYSVADWQVPPGLLPASTALPDSRSVALPPIR